MVTRIDRLARSIKDLQDIVYTLKEWGVSLKATEQPIDTLSAAGKAFLDMLGVFAEFETNLRRERQLEEIADAKARGVYRGRKLSIDSAEVQRLRAEEKPGATEIARRLGVGRASVYRVLAQYGSQAYRADHGKPRKLQKAELERYCDLVAALKLRTTNKNNRHLSTANAIKLLEDFGVETNQGLISN